MLLYYRNYSNSMELFLTTLHIVVVWGYLLIVMITLSSSAQLFQEVGEAVIDCSCETLAGLHIERTNSEIRICQWGEYLRKTMLLQIGRAELALNISQSSSIAITCQLIISNISESDSGIYKCFEDDGFGEVKTKRQLTNQQPTLTLNPTLNPTPNPTLNPP